MCVAMLPAPKAEKTAKTRVHRLVYGPFYRPSVTCQRATDTNRRVKMTSLSRYLPLRDPDLTTGCEYDRPLARQVGSQTRGSYIRVKDVLA